jgi:beta-phosphoglucomutase
MLRAIIFDLDGVLAATDHLHTKAWRKTCKDWNIPFSNETAELLRGVGRLDCADIIADHGKVQLTDAARERFAEQKNTRYIELLDCLTEENLLPDAKELLSQIRRRGIPRAVASSSKNAVKILQKTGLMDFFDIVVDGNQIHRSKPDPEVFQRAADRLGAPYGDCLVVEDAVSGVEAARAMGALIAVIGNAALKTQADYTLTSLRDLLPVIDALRQSRHKMFP